MRRAIRVALLAALAAGATISFLAVMAASEDEPAQAVIVLGFDGMDHRLASKLLAEGRLPNLARLASSGGFAPLASSTPPQSPVAWAGFITGLDSGGHGIFDFIHINRETLTPYLSISRATPPSHFLRLGSWQLPLSGGGAELLVQGQPFWAALKERGIDTTVIRIPSNFPPSGLAGRELSGMGTPDLLGSYGTFAFYTSDPKPYQGREIDGGEIYPVTPADGVVRAELHGPANTYRNGEPRATMPFSVLLDPDRPLARIEVDGTRALLREGDWSDWIPVTFPLIPTQSVRAIVRFRLKQVRPVFELYASPLNIDPLDPAMPISSPPSFAQELARATGRFYTQGMPEDTNALSNGVFSRAEFLAQARLVEDELVRQYHYLLGRFQHGLLFYYFSSSDQVSHMMWRALDPAHPAYDRAMDPPFADTVPALYTRLDAVVGHTLENMPPGAVLVVMSDHGFTSWRRSFNVNTWLAAHGYLHLRFPRRSGTFGDIDWTRTRAYAFGLNGLYVNLAGRSRWGIVPPGERDALLAEIADTIEDTIDPATGKPVVWKAYQRDLTYVDQGAMAIGPDMVLGYHDGYRASNESALGEVALAMFTDNTGPWSGDHCMDQRVTPGVLFTSRPLRRPAPRLQDLGVALAAELGAPGLPVREDQRGK